MIIESAAELFPHPWYLHPRTLLAVATPRDRDNRFKRRALRGLGAKVHIFVTEGYSACGHEECQLDIDLALRCVDPLIAPTFGRAPIRFASRTRLRERASTFDPQGGLKRIPAAPCEPFDLIAGVQAAVVECACKADAYWTVLERDVSRRWVEAANEFMLGHGRVKPGQVRTEPERSYARIEHLMALKHAGIPASADTWMLEQLQRDQRWHQLMSDPTLQRYDEYAAALASKKAVEVGAWADRIQLGDVKLLADALPHQLCMHCAQAHARHRLTYGQRSPDVLQERIAAQSGARSLGSR